MKLTGNRSAKIRKAVVTLFAAMLLGLAFGPAGAHAAKIDNPSPPNFKAEITGGFLQFLGTAADAKPLQLDMDFGGYDPPLSNPTMIGSVVPNANGYGVITVPQANVNFPPIPVNVDDVAITVRLQPTGNVTGMIDPLSGRVDLSVPIKLKAEGAAMGQNLGGNCYIGSDGNPIVIATSTHTGAFPTTNPTPAQTTYVGDYVTDGGSYAGGWLAAEPYSEDAGVWPSGPALVPGKPVGSAPKPVPDEIPYNPLTDFKPRGTGTWRGLNETLAAPKATNCGSGVLAGTITDQVNSLIGLPSNPGASTASFDFQFVPFTDRTGPNAIVRRAVRSSFIAPGLSSDPWPATQVPTAVSSQSVNLNASSSYFKAGAHPTQAYAFDFGSGTFGAPTSNPATSFNVPFIPEGGNPITLSVRVKATDTAGDTNITIRKVKVVPATDITLGTEISSVAGAGKLRGGSSGQIKFNVRNASTTDLSSQSIAFEAALPSGVSLNSVDAPAAWSCNSTSSTISCTVPQGALAPNQIDPIKANVSVDTTAPNPANVTASAVMTGDPNVGNNTVNQNIPVAKTDLAVNVSHADQLVANGWFPYTIAVANVGDAATVGGATVNVSLPSGFSYRSQGSGGTDWTCTPANPQSISCSRSVEVAGNASAPNITIWAKIDANTPEEARAVDATVTTQGDVNAFSGADSDSDSDTVYVRNDLVAHVGVTGSYTVGDPGQITYSVSNGSVVGGTVPTTIASALPAGLTVSSVSGSGWDCSATVPGSSDIQCEHAAGLAGGATTGDLTATVDVAQAAYPGKTIPVSLTNSQDAFAPNNSDSAFVQVKRIDVAIQKLAVKPFNVGIEGRYRLNVTNTGDAPTVGDITVTDTVPAGLKVKGASGAGWDCSASVIGGSDVICHMTNTLGAGIQAAPIEIRVDVLDAAAQAGTVSNTAYVDTPRDTRGEPADAAVTPNNTSTVVTAAVAVDLSIESRHQGAFRADTDDLYSLDVRNVGFFGTDEGEPVTVTDDLPEGVIPDVANIETTRPGWVCSENSGDVTCTLDAPDALTSAMEPESSVTIDIPVHVTDAAADSSDNVAEVSTARDSNPLLSPNNVATDPTTVKRIDLAVAGTVSIPPRAGGIGEMTIEVYNVGSAATVDQSTVVMPLATGVSFRPAGSVTAGWHCSSLGAGTQVTCVRSPIIASGGQTPPLKLRTNVGANAPASWNSQLAVSTNGEPNTRLVNNQTPVAHTLETIDLALSKSHDAAANKAGKRGSYKIEVRNVGNTATVAGYRVQDTVNATFQNVSAGGPGWTCSVTGNALDCTRTAVIGAGGSASDITVGYDIPGTSAGTKDSTATVSSTDDPFPGNNSAGDPISIVATADVTVEVDQPAWMRIGDTVAISYNVRNIGADATAGGPSATLKVLASDGLKPVGNAGDGDWSCDAVEAENGNPAYLDCAYSGSIGAGSDSTLIGQFDVVPTTEDHVDTGAVVGTPGDVNPANNYATASSSLSGVDLEVTVAAAGSSTDHMVAGTTATRAVTVGNVGTSSSTGPVRVSVELPEGLQWDSAVGAGAGWSCSQLVRKVTCERGDQLAPAGTAPVLNLGLRASKSNAPSVDVEYVVATGGDENASNDVAVRSEEVRYNPDTVITSAPVNGSSKSANVAFESPDSNVTFECKTDTGSFAACTSPFSVSGLSIGEHNIQVRAINQFGLIDDSPASVSWEITSTPKTGPKTALKMESTGGTLSLATLGAVDLPKNQVKLEGDLFTDNGGLTIPKDKVVFLPVVQTIEDAIGPGTNVGVTIRITATGDADGVLPNGGGPASFVLPVRVDIEAVLNGSTPLIPAGTECAVKPITFDMAGTYDEGAGTVHLEQQNVAFPTVTGCGTFGPLLDSQLELPRNDIQMALDFSVVKGSPVTPQAKLAKPVIKAPKKIKSGKKMAVKVLVKNGGDGKASNVKVCLKTPKKFFKGKRNICRTITSIEAGKTGVAKFKIPTRKVKKKAKARIKATASAVGLPATNRLKHVSLLK